MPRLRKTPDKLVFLVILAAPDKLLLLPLLLATAFFGLVEFAAIQESGSSFLVISLILAVLLFLDLLFLGTLYVFDRPANQITAYRGPFPVHRHVLSDLVDVEVKMTTDDDGDTIALGSLLFLKEVPFRLNSFSTTSTGELFRLQRDVRAFLPPSPERAAREEAEREAKAAKESTVAAVPQVLSALWKAKGTDAIRHPREAMTFVLQHLSEHESDPVIRGLM
jgi:hypothetical protein